MSLGKRNAFDVVKLLELRGLTCYALTHIKQALKDEFFTVICILLFFIVLHGEQGFAVSYFLPQTLLVFLTAIAFPPHYQMLNQCTGGHHQLPST